MKQIIILLLLLFSVSTQSQSRKLNKIKEIKRSVDQKGAISIETTKTYDVVYKGDNIEKFVNNSAEVVNNIQGQSGVSTMKYNFEIVFSYDSSNNLILREERDANTKNLKSKIEFVYNSKNQLIELNSFGTNATIPRKWKFNYISNKISEIIWMNRLGSYDRKDTIIWKNNNPINVNSYEPSGKLFNTISIKYDLSKTNKFNRDFSKFFVQNIIFEVNNIYQYLCENEIIQIIEPNNKVNKNLLPYEIEYDFNGYPTRIKRGTKGGIEYFFTYQ